MSRLRFTALVLFTLAAFSSFYSTQAADPVVVQTDAGVFRLDVEPDPSGTTALQGVAFTAELPAGDGVLAISGQFSAGELAGTQLRGQAAGMLDEAYQSNQYGNALAISQANLALELENSSLQTALLTDMQVSMVLPLNSQGAQVSGVAIGLLHGSAISFQSELSLVAPFIYQQGSVSAAMKTGDSLQVFVNKGAFVGAAFQALELQVGIPFEGDTLIVSGESAGVINATGGIDVVGTLGLDKPFVYKKGVVTATLGQGGGVQIQVVDSSVRQAALLGAQVVIALSTPSADLVVGGETDSALEPDGLTFTAQLSVLEPFSYRSEDVSATLRPGGAVTVTIEQSQFKFAELTGLEVEVDLEIGDDTLRLGGSVDTGMGPEYTISFNAQLGVLEPFVYEKGDVSATLKPGGVITVAIERSQFKFAELTGLEVEVDLEIGDDTLRLGGSVDTGMGPDYSISFNAQLDVLEPFVYEKGDVSATFEPGGAVAVTVEQSEFKFAELTGFELKLEVSVRGADLALAGSVDGRLNNDGSISFDGRLALAKDFVYKRGRLNAKIESGNEWSVRVRGSRFLRASLDDQPILTELAIPGSQPAIMRGKIISGSLTRWLVMFRAQVTLETTVTFGNRWWKRTVEPGEGVLAVFPWLATFKGEGGSFVVLLSS